MTRKALTPEMLAALASGVAVQASVAPAPAASPAAPAAPAAPAEAPAAEASAAPAATHEEVGTEAEHPSAPAAAAAPAPSVASTDVTAFLQGQLTAKDAALLANGVEIAGLKAKIADYDASVGGLLDIARASLNNMRVALGGARTDLSALTASEVLAQHAAAKGDFETRFVAGGVAAVDAAQETNASRAPALDSLEQARLRAVMPNRRG